MNTRPNEDGETKDLWRHWDKLSHIGTSRSTLADLAIDSERRGTSLPSIKHSLNFSSCDTFKHQAGVAVPRRVAPCVE
jgi:hypothetical protein